MNKHIHSSDAEKYCKHIINHVPCVLVVFGIENRMLHVRYLSDNCIHISGFTPDEIYARSSVNPIADVHPHDRMLFKVSAWDTTQNTLSFTYRMICKNGQYKWVHMELSRVDESGEVLYYGLFSDVDKQHKLLEHQEREQTIYQMQRELQNMYDNILNELHTMITVIDAETYEVIYANKLAIQMAQTQGSYIGCICYKGIHHIEKPCKECLLLKRDAAPVEVTEVTYAGHIYRMLKKIFTWNDRKLLLECSEDISEQYRVKEVEKELNRDKEKEKVLLNSIPGGVALYHIMNDGTVRISYISEGLAGILGYTAKEFIRRYKNDTKECVVVEDRHIISAAIKNILETHTPISNHYRCYAKNGAAINLSFDGNVIDLGEKLPGEIATLYAVQTLISDKHQKEIQEEEIRQKLMNYVPGGIGIYHLYNGIATLQYLNDAYLTMMELKKEDREQYYGHDISGVFYPEDRHVLTEMIEEIYQGKRLTNVLFRIRSGSGKWKWVNLVMRILPEGNEHYTGYASLYDFDKVVLAQQEMEAAHKKEETLLSSIPGGIAIYHLKKNGKVATEYVSEPLAEMCGYTAEEFFAYLKEDSLINLLPEDIPVVNAAVARGLEDHKTISVIYHIYKKDRTPILIRLDANVIQSAPLAEDEIAVFYGVHTLVSDESKRMMNEQKTLSLLLNSVPAGIGIFEVENGVLNQEYMNDAFFEILHSTREERSQYSGKNALATIHPHDLPCVQEAIGALVQGDSAMQVDYRLMNGLGSYTWFHVTTSVTERREGYLRFFTAFFDCTSSKEQELMLLQNKRAVELAQTQGDFSIWTYNIDKRTILQQIQSTAHGHMDYPIRIERVPECFIDSGSVHPEDIDQFRKAYQDLSDGTENVDITYRLLNHCTGKFSWLRMFYQRMEHSSENDRMAVGFSMNVDKQQEAIERYRVEQTLREQMNDNVLMYLEYNLTKDCYQTEGKITNTYCKAEWEGVSANDYMAALSLSVEDAYANEVAEKLYSKNLLRAFAAGETKVCVEYRSKARPNMPSVWYRTSASLVKRPDTGDIMAFIDVKNIDAEKERKLAMENSLSDGIESIAVIHIADRRALLIRDDYSPAEKVITESYFTYDDAFVWRSHTAVVEEERAFAYQAGLLTTILKELEHQEIYQYSIGAHSKTGVFKRQLFRHRYLDDRKMAIVLSVSDITSIYMEEQAKKRQIEQALAETKKASAAKADFYSRMSHDMRTPMNGILGMTALSAQEQDVAVLQRNMEKIHESGNYLLNLINDTLDLQRIESGKLKLEPQIVHTAKSVDSLLEMVQPMADAKGVMLQFDKGNADFNWYVRTDPVRIKQIFVNLLSNAIKFTPPGGTVKFASQLLGHDGMISHAVFTISDTGIGMGEAFLKNGIFQPFSQENNQITANYAGSGLGLSIVKSLVEIVDGHIGVESELGVGTTFTVFLDFERVDRAEAQRILNAEKTQSKDVTAVLNGKQILLVEDHPLNAEISKKLLEKVGCIVTWAQNGQLGVDAFAASGAWVFDAVLMDIRMPVMDGLEATRHIRALARVDAKTVPIIAMTANAYEDDMKKSVAAGMNAHLGKPIEPQKLYESLAQTIAGSR